MASIPVTIIGTLTYTDVGVGGGPMPGGPEVSHPIAPGGPPLQPAHPIVIPPDAIAPGVPAHPIVLPPPYPAHPIVIPPDAIAPGVPEHPIVLPPPYPAHPIVIPPDAIAPGVPAHPIYLPPIISGGPIDPYPSHPIAPGGPPPGIWPSPGVPTHPIVLPPDLPDSFTVVVKNNTTGEWKAMKFVPAPEVPPAAPGTGPKT